MLSVSIITNYINIFDEVEPLRKSLQSWTDQTHPALEILMADSSKPGLERKATREVALSFGVTFIERPFNHYTSYTAANINHLVDMAQGEAILWLCPMWWLQERTWIERMAKRLEEYGPGYIVATDNDRRHLSINPDGSGPYIDQFAGAPTIFLSPEPAYVDNPKMMFYWSDWIPMDTDFDPPPNNFPQRAANAHGVVYWGWQQVRAGRKILLCRDFQMEHAPARPFPGEHLEQVYGSDAIMRRKIALTVKVPHGNTVERSQL